MAAEYLFEDGGGFPVAVPYVGVDGERQADGVKTFSLDQAAARFRLPHTALVETWLKTWGKILPAPGAEAAGSSPLPTGEALTEHVIRRMLCGHLSDEHYAQFRAICEARGLSILCNQVHAETAWDAASKSLKLVVITHIDGFRALAQRTGMYDGQSHPEWCGEDGRWVDVWTKQDPPVAARVGVYKKGCERPHWGIANWQMYAPYIETQNGRELPEFWAKGGPHMLAKVAEALGFRKAMPETFGGIFTRDEMDQASPRRAARPRQAGEPERASPSTPALAPVDRRDLMLTLHQWGLKSETARNEVLARCRRDFGRRFGDGEEEYFFGQVLQTVTSNPVEYGAVRPPMS